MAGVFNGRLKIALSAPPVEGKANQALVRFIALKAGIPRASVSIASGQLSRDKRVLVSGLTPGELAAKLAV